MADFGIPNTVNSPLVYIGDSSNFSLINCNLNNDISYPNSNLILIKNSSIGLVKNNKFNYGKVSIKLYNSTGITIANNNLSVMESEKSNNIFIYNNNFTYQNPEILTPGNIVIVFGTNNTILNNFIDSKKTPCCTLIVNTCCGPEPDSAKYKGADDGIGIGTESNAIIINNTIINAWDCGIETVGLISNSIISNNTLIDNDYCGIGGWYNMGLINNTFEQNTIVNSRYGFTFFYHNTPTSPSYTGNIFFTNNTFNSNLGINVTHNGFSIVCLNYPICNDYQNLPFVAGSNKFNLNNFTKYFGGPAYIEVDGEYISFTQVPAFITCSPKNIINGSNNYCRNLIDDVKCNQIASCMNF